MRVHEVASTLLPVTHPTTRLSVRAVTRLFGDTVALRGLSLDAASGELVVVHGPNGSGKSTLLRVIAGVLEPSLGAIEWRVADGAGAPRIALLTHATHLVDALTTRENLELARRLARSSRRVDDLLAALGLTAVADHAAAGLSAGTRRRCGLARALITDPQVLLVDEPFAALDRAAAALVRTALIEARREARLVVIATHDAAAGDLAADQVLDLSARRLRPLPAAASA